MSAISLGRWGLVIVAFAALDSGAQQTTRTPERLDPAAIVTEREGMVLVPAGDFTMGSAPGEDWASTDESPQRVVRLPAFLIDQLEVTNIDYQRFLDATGWRPPPSWKEGHYPEDADFIPVTEVTWWDATAYARWAGKRLPTEAEWEKAARDADGRRFPWGKDFSPERANDGKVPLPPGSKPEGASPYGALDMAGNVAEWTASAYAPYPDLEATLPGEFGGKPSGGQAGGRDESTSPATGPGSSPAPSAAGEREIAPNDPRLAFFGKDELQDERPRAYRGGSFNSYGKFLRCADRQKDKPGARWSNLGFRCAADAGSAGGAKP